MDKRIRQYIGMGLLAACPAAGCSDDVPQEKGLVTTAVSFRMATRAAENSPEEEITDRQFTRLYVAERKPETDEILYCDKFYDLDGQTYHLENLQGIWYKFAFVCVPDVVDGMGSGMFPDETEFERDKDLHGFKINYAPVLAYQAGLNEASKAGLSIYRKVIDRWIDADMPTEEDVVMNRITGRLVLNMGKPADQFDTKTKGAVTEITVSMETPTDCYIRDESCDSVIVENKDTKSFTWTVAADKQLEEQVLPIDLLPGELANAKVTISFDNGAKEEYTLQGRAGEETKADNIVIKKNTRTIVLFNGKEKDMFEVRYAGFADGNDAWVDVDDDAWDGL